MKAQADKAAALGCGKVICSCDDRHWWASLLCENVPIYHGKRLKFAVPQESWATFPSCTCCVGFGEETEEEVRIRLLHSFLPLLETNLFPSTRARTRRRSMYHNKHHSPSPQSHKTELKLDSRNSSAIVMATVHWKFFIYLLFLSVVRFLTGSHTQKTKKNEEWPVHLGSCISRWPAASLCTAFLRRWWKPVAPYLIVVANS